MAWIWAVLLALTTLSFLARQQYTNRKIKQKKLPPGPRGLPIIGCFHLLGKSPHRNLHKLAQKHGPIMHLRLGLVPTIIVSSSEAAESFLKTHDLNFATRPPHECARQFLYNQKSMSFVPYGSYWRNIRKMITLELLSSRKISSFKDVRNQELGLFMESIREVSKQRVPIDVSAKVASLGADVTCRMIVGKKYSDEDLDARGFKGMLSEAMKLMGAPNFGDYIPQIAPLDLQGLRRKMKAVSQVFDRFLDGIIDDHIKSRDGPRGEDLVDVMLGFLDSEESEYQICRDDMKAIILDLLVASMDTSAAIIEWCLSELMKQPQIVTKLQNELEEKVGLDRTVEESDIEKLEYLSMVVRETFRLHPPVPLLLPHAAREDCDIDGFHIPKNSHVIFNAWAIGRDPGAWVDPEEFYPERFRGSEVDVRGRDFQLIPFGSGRRGCPGMQLALVFVHLVLANLVHSFDWELPAGMFPDELDMTEQYGLVMPKATHLVAIPKYRLHIGSQTVLDI